MKKNKKEWLFLLFLLINFTVFCQVVETKLEVLINGRVIKTVEHPEQSIPDDITAKMGDEIEFGYQ